MLHWLVPIYVHAGFIAIVTIDIDVIAVKEMYIANTHSPEN